MVKTPTSTPSSIIPQYKKSKYREKKLSPSAKSVIPDFRDSTISLSAAAAFGINWKLPKRFSPPVPVGFTVLSVSSMIAQNDCHTDANLSRIPPKNRIGAPHMQEIPSVNVVSPSLSVSQFPTYSKNSERPEIAFDPVPLPMHQAPVQFSCPVEGKYSGMSRA